MNSRSFKFPKYTTLIVLCYYVLAQARMEFSFKSLSFQNFISSPPHILFNLQVSDSNHSIGAVEPECDNGVCKLPQKVISTKFEIPVDVNESEENYPTSDVVEEKNVPENITVNEMSDESKVLELTKMGWTPDEAKYALELNNMDVDESAQFLDNELAAIEAFNENVQKLVDLKWRPDVAVDAIKACNGNTTEALEMLEKEEVTIKEQFEDSVKGMVANGWEEYIARQALLAQWSIDQSKASGQNFTVTPSELAAIFPTLKVKPSTEGTQTPKGTTSKGAPTTTTTATKSNMKGGSSTSTSNGVKKSTTSSSSSTPKTTPTPAKPEDCIFEVTINTLQKVVFDSPVPVVIDVYADWCGPCKQLGPMLEAAAVKSGGMFRLAKVNSDRERSIAEALGVKGLPSVYGMNNGKINDRFVGMLPQNKLQDFFVRLVTGYGERVQPEETSEEELKEFTQKLALAAGFASFGFKKKEKLRAMILDALHTVDALLKSTSSSSEDINEEEEGEVAYLPSEGVTIALQYINNAAKDIRNPKLRILNAKGNSTIFLSKVIPCQAAMKLLDIAGFKQETEADIQGGGASKATTTGGGGGKEKSLGVVVPNKMVLVHNNVAVITFVSQQVVEYFQNLRAEAMKRKHIRKLKASSSKKNINLPPVSPTVKLDAKEDDSSNNNEIHNSISTTSTATTTTTTTTIAPAVKPNVLTVSVRCSDRSILRSSFPPSTTLREAMDQILESKGGEAEGWEHSEVRFPPPRKEYSQDSTYFDRTLEDILSIDPTATTISISLVEEDMLSSTVAVDKKTSTSQRADKGSVPPTKKRALFGSLFTRKSEEENSKIKSKKAKEITPTKKSGSGGTHTLFSTGILAVAKKKNNEYFGGDSTVVQAAEEDDDEEEEEVLIEEKKLVQEGSSNSSKDDDDTLDEEEEEEENEDSDDDTEKDMNSQSSTSSNNDDTNADEEGDDEEEDES